MSSAKQRLAARRNVKRAASVARKKKTIAQLPKKIRTALGKHAAKVEPDRTSLARCRMSLNSK